MIVTLQMTAESSGEAFDDLSRWLFQESSLAGRVKRPGAPPIEGQMGSVMDMVAVAVGSGGAVTVLASSLQAWFSQSRWQKVDLTVIATSGKKSRSVHLTAEAVSSPEFETALKALIKAVDEER